MKFQISLLLFFIWRYLLKLQLIEISFFSRAGFSFLSSHTLKKPNKIYCKIFRKERSFAITYISIIMTMFNNPQYIHSTWILNKRQVIISSHQEIESKIGNEMLISATMWIRIMRRFPILVIFSLGFHDFHILMRFLCYFFWIWMPTNQSYAG